MAYGSTCRLGRINGTGAAWDADTIHFNCCLLVRRWSSSIEGNISFAFVSAVGKQRVLVLGYPRRTTIIAPTPMHASQSHILKLHRTLRVQFDVGCE
jgi:hypothetical protein